MKEEDDDGILDVGGKKIRDYLRNVSIGWTVHPEELENYEKLKKIFDENHVQMNTDGGEFVIRVALKLCETFFSDANSMYLKPLEYTEDMVDKICEAIITVDNKSLFANLTSIQKKTRDALDKRIIEKIKPIISK